MIIKREIETSLKDLSKKYPVVTITGPRQSGKTTLVKYVFKNKPYLNLEAPDIREFATTDPRGFLNQIPDGAIIDEIQRVPELLSYIQVIVDEKRINGMFILTGSQQFELSNSISQSLAGRTALLKLLPFSISELLPRYAKLDVNELLYRGFFPRIYDHNLNPTKTLSDYFETYVERDLRELIQIKNLMVFQKFVKMCAGRVGQLLNLQNLANDVGISHTTAREWLTLLQASYVVFLLEPHYANIKKRLIKSPKLYFYDVALASFLLGIENKTHIVSHPLRGNLFENMVVIDLLKKRFNNAKQNNLVFYRDSNGNEVDILYKIGARLLPIEIKAGETISQDYVKGICSFEKIIENPFGGIVAYAGNQTQTRGNINVCNFKDLDNNILEKETSLLG